MGGHPVELPISINTLADVRQVRERSGSRPSRSSTSITRWNSLSC